MNAEIIDLTAERKKRMPQNALQEALAAVAEEGKYPLKSIELLDNYFKEHPYKSSRKSRSKRR